MRIDDQHDAVDEPTGTGEDATVRTDDATTTGGSEDATAAPRALTDLVGHRLSVKVLEVDPKRNRLILSEKAAAQEIRKRRKAKAAKVGDRVRVRVIAIDRERDRISLSIRQLAGDRWSRVGTDIQMGQDVEATITKLMPFGAFARIAEGLEGLIHVSELSNEHVADPADVVKVGDRVNVRLVGIEPGRRRLSLSIRQAGR